MAGEFNAGFPARKAVEKVQYGAGIVTNPLCLPVAIVGGSGGAVSLKNNFLTNTYFTSLTTPSDMLATAVAGTSAVKILDVTGSGFLTHVMSPSGDSANSSIATITFIVDGVTYNYVTTVGIPLNNRLVFGALLTGNPVISTPSAAADIPLIGGYNDYGHLVKYGKTPNVFNAMLPTAHQIASFCMPRLRFEKSISVIIKMSAVPAAYTNALVGVVLD